MRKNITIGVVLLLVAFFVFHGSSPEIVIDGSRITIDSGSDHIEGALETEAVYHILMKDEAVSINTFSGDASVMALPLKTAEELRTKYGDFFRCNAPGAMESLRQMHNIVLVTDNEQAREAISEAIKLVRSSRIPVVAFEGARIRVTRHTSMNMNVVDGTGKALFHVNDFKILKPDYLR